MTLLKIYRLACNLNNQEAEAEGLQVRDLPRLHREKVPPESISLEAVASCSSYTPG